MPKIPKLCRHKHTGQGYATDPATGKEKYFGQHGTTECQQAYDSWVIALLARRQAVASGTPPGAKVTVARLVTDYLDHAKKYYRKHGKQTSEYGSVRKASDELVDLFGEIEAGQFSPLQFKSLREAMIGKGLAREHINNQMSRVKRVWKWGVENELVGPEVLTALQAVAPLTRGRTPARETDPIEPVPLPIVWRTVEKLDKITAILVQVQLFGCMRAAEAVIMRAEDIDTSQDPWLYVPWTHKTEHKGRQRRIWLGKPAQDLLRPLLTTTGWLFPGQGKGKNANRYSGPLTVAGYRQRIERCCEEHGIPPWFPLQLRHTALTMVRASFGLEAAQHAAGHSEASITEIYAEKNEALARKIASDMKWEAT